MPILLSLLACVAYVAVWSDFFSATRMFGDYGLSIPTLLDYYFWAHRNGWAVQWFTPGMCGGMPVFPEPQSSQYSLLALLAFLWGPTAGVKVAFLLHAWLGFLGAYVLCRRSFGMRMESSLVAAMLFMFNGFYAYRILVSHLFFGLMFTPALAFLLLESFRRQPWWNVLVKAVAAGLLFAMYVYSGGLGVALPFCIGVAILVVLHWAISDTPPSLRSVALAILLFAVTSLALCYPKLLATSAFMSQFPRDSYRLPGFNSIYVMLKATWTMFFFSPADALNLIYSGFTNAQWRLDRHEWEFGVTLTPMLLLLAALGNSASLTFPKGGRKKLFWCLIVILLLIPPALNFYTPEWNHWIKQTPVLKSSSNLLRFFWIWVVFLCFAPALFFDRHCALPTLWHRTFAGLCMAFVALTFLTHDKDYYRSGSTYDPGSVEHAYQEVATGRMQPAIHALDVLRDAQGQVIAPGDRNKTLAEGISQLLCYQPIFGYRLEKFPFGALHPGSPVDPGAPGHLNFKNPACMVYPDANGCKAGDEFRADQHMELQRLLNYEGYDFALPAQQVRANMIGIGTLIAALLVMLVAIVRKLRVLWRRP